MGNIDGSLRIKGIGINSILIVGQLEYVVYLFATPHISNHYNPLACLDKLLHENNEKKQLLYFLKRLILWNVR